MLFLLDERVVPARYSRGFLLLGGGGRRGQLGRLLLATQPDLLEGRAALLAQLHHVNRTRTVVLGLQHYSRAASAVVPRRRGGQRMVVGRGRRGRGRDRRRRRQQGYPRTVSPAADHVLVADDLRRHRTAAYAYRHSFVNLK